MSVDRPMKDNIHQQPAFILSVQRPQTLVSVWLEGLRDFSYLPEVEARVLLKKAFGPSKLGKLDAV